MDSKFPDKVIFLDYDGCMTSVKEGNYFNPDPDKYHPSKLIVKSLKSFCKENSCKIVLSTNWRKFDIDGEWKNAYGTFKNPLKELKAMLGDCLLDVLPAVRHVRKPQAVILWLEETGYDGSFVAFDDDLREGFQDTTDYKINDRFVFVDSTYGITTSDLKKAKRILEEKGQ